MSQKHYEIKTIEGHEYQIQMLPPLISHDLLMDVLKMLGPSFGPIIDQMAEKKDKNILEMKITSDFFSKAIEKLFLYFDKSLSKNLIQTMAKSTLVNGQKLEDQFDIHFRGQLDQMYKWLIFACQVQWGKCLGALGSLLESQSAKKELE